MEGWTAKQDGVVEVASNKSPNPLKFKRALTERLPMPSAWQAHFAGNDRFFVDFILHFAQHWLSLRSL